MSAERINGIFDRLDILNRSSKSKAAARRLCFSAAFITFFDEPAIAAQISPAYRPIELDGFSMSALGELLEYLRGYNEKIYVFEQNGEIFLALPSIYPTSTSTLIIRLEQKPSLTLRAIYDWEKGEKGGLFVLSPNINTSPAKFSAALEGVREDAFALFTDIKECFCTLESISFENVKDGGEDISRELCEHFLRISVFFGIPLEIKNIEICDAARAEKTNFPLLTAFVTLMLMLAKEKSLTRSAELSFSSLDGALVAEVRIPDSDSVRMPDAVLWWEYIAGSKRMLFEHHGEGGKLFMRFHPLYRDWSYLGIKQEKADGREI